MLVKLAAIFFSMILVNNYVLVKFYGICRSWAFPRAGFLHWYVRRCYLCYAGGNGCHLPHPDLRSEPADLGYLQTIVFILVIAVLVQFIEIFLKKYVVALYNSLGVYLP